MKAGILLSYNFPRLRQHTFYDGYKDKRFCCLSKSAQRKNQNQQDNQKMCMLSRLMGLTNIRKNIIYFIDREGLVGNYCFVGNEYFFF